MQILISMEHMGYIRMKKYKILRNISKYINYTQPLIILIALLVIKKISSGLSSDYHLDYHLDYHVII